MKRKVIYGEKLPTLELALNLSGKSIEISRMTVEAQDEYVSTNGQEGLTYLALSIAQS